MLIHSFGEITHHESTTEMRFSDKILKVFAVGIEEEEVEGVKLANETVEESSIVGTEMSPVVDDFGKRDAVHGGAEISHIAVVRAFFFELEGDLAGSCDFSVCLRVCLEPAAVVND